MAFALPIAGLAIGAAGSAVAASSQNRAIRGSQAAQGRAFVTNASQVNEQAALEQRKRQQEARVLQSRIRVLAGESGSTGGSFAALNRQAAFDAELNQLILERNRQNQIASLASGAAANIASLQNSTTNTVLAGITGGLGGAQTGLAIEGARRELTRSTV